MARKHRRENHEPPPLTISPQDVPRGPRPKSYQEIQAERARRDEARWERQGKEWALRKEQERKEVSKRLNWKLCLVPLCDLGVPEQMQDDPRIMLPLCNIHATVAWTMVERWSGREGVARTSQQIAEEERRRKEEAQKRRLANRDGHIYYVRLNGLIKVGWSRELGDRLRAYGPDVEILCHHKGSRDDETALHRNLRPFLARGREWYEDCPAMRDIIAQAVERHGEPCIKVTWTRPTEPPIKRRKR